MTLPWLKIVRSEHRDAWLSARRAGVCSSDVPAIMGASPFASAVEIWLEKISAADDREDTERMRWGRLLEGIILEETCRRAGVHGHRNDWLIVSTEHALAMATPDGFTSDAEPVEVKNLRFTLPEEWESYGIPRHYYLQCQQHMRVTGAKRCLFGALVAGGELVWCWVERDEEECARIAQATEGFWRHVTLQTPPPSDGSRGARNALSQRAGEGSVDLDTDAVEELLDAIAIAKAEEKCRKKAADAAEKSRRAHEDALAAMLGSAERGETLGGIVVEWVVSERAGYTVQPAVSKTLKIRKPKRCDRGA